MEDYQITLDCYDLGISFKEWILPRLKKFKQVTNSYPSKLNSMEEWQEILDIMIEGFELIGFDVFIENTDENLSVEQLLRINKHNAKKTEYALEFFKKYLLDLWI